MFRALRILPVLAVLGAVAMVGKAGEILVSLDGPGEARADNQPAASSRLLAQLQPAADERPPIRTDAGLEPSGAPARDVGAAPLALPPSPEAMLAPAAGDAGGDAAEAPDTEEAPAVAGEDAPANEVPGRTAAFEGVAEGVVVPPSDPVRDPFDMSDEELELLQRLVERREALAERGRTLDQREALLEATEARIADKMNELRELQAAIESLLVKYDEEEEARLQSLVKIYESMKPKDAARIFEELDILVLLDVIGRMKERKSAPILAKMNPSRAKTVTLELAQRRTMPFARE